MQSGPFHLQIAKGCGMQTGAGLTVFHNPDVGVGLPRDENWGITRERNMIFLTCFAYKHRRRMSGVTDWFF